MPALKKPLEPPIAEDPELSEDDSDDDEPLSHTHSHSHHVPPPVKAPPKQAPAVPPKSKPISEPKPKPKPTPESPLSRQSSTRSVTESEKAFHGVEAQFYEGRESKLPKEVLMTSEGIIPLSAGTNRFASQKGQTGFGVPRDVIEKVKASNLKEVEDEKANRSKEIIPLQMGTNRFASQKGMTGIGAVRDVMYKPKFLSTEDPISEEKQRMSDGIIPLQMGTNKLASQRGMTAMGTNRPLWSKENQEQAQESQGFIHLQMGTNQGESQKGMTAFGAIRLNVSKAVDSKRPEIISDASVIPMQSLGSSTGDSQAGMGGFGSFRNNTQQLGPKQSRASQGYVPYQMGINWAESQSGKTAFGMPRLTTTQAVDDTRDPLPESLALDPATPLWSSGYSEGASQKGMTGIGVPRDVAGRYLRRLW
jgi:hypothetical protein